MDLLALVVYEVILFPHIDQCIDFVAIGVFLALSDMGESLVLVVLADTYCTFNYYYKNKGQKILCCLPMLYVRFTTHVFNNKWKVSCYIEDFNMCIVEVKNSRR